MSRLTTLTEDIAEQHRLRHECFQAQADLEAMAWELVKIGQCSCVWNLVERDGVTYSEIVLEDPGCRMHAQDSVIRARAWSRIAQ